MRSERPLFRGASAAGALGIAPSTGMLGGMLGVVLALVAVAGCTVVKSDIAECIDNRECRTAFGVGAVCQSDGFCARPEAPARCTKTYPDDLLSNPEAYRDTIVIGNLMDRSLATHQARENAVQLAFEQANAEGGITGREFGVVFCTIEESDTLDTLSRQEAAVDSARHLVDIIGVPAIIGPAASSDTQAVFLEVRDDRVLVISPSATSPALSSLDPIEVGDDSPGLLWRTAPPDSLQGQAIAADMSQAAQGRIEAVDSVAVIQETGAYGEGLAAVFADAFTGSETFYLYDDPESLTEAVTRAGQGPFDEVLFVSSQVNDVIAFIAAASDESFQDKGIFLTDSAANGDFLDFLESAPAVRSDTVRGSRPAPLDEANDLVYSMFLAAYSTRFDDEAEQYSFSAHAYDAAWLVAYGIAWATFQENDQVNGETIAKGLRRLSSGTSLEIRPSNWNGVQQNFMAGQSVDIAGASGALDYQSNTEETGGDIEIWQIVDGQISRLYVP